MIEIVASAVVVWQLKGVEGSGRERRALRIIAVAFVLLSIYIAVQSALALSSHFHPGHSTVGTVWLAATVVAMFVLAGGKRDTGRRLGNPVLQAESRVTVIDGALAATVLLADACSAPLRVGVVASLTSIDERIVRQALCLSRVFACASRGFARPDCNLSLKAASVRSFVSLSTLCVLLGEPGGTVERRCKTHVKHGQR